MRLAGLATPRRMPGGPGLGPPGDPDFRLHRQWDRDLAAARGREWDGGLPSRRPESSLRLLWHSHGSGVHTGHARWSPGRRRRQWQCHSEVVSNLTVTVLFNFKLNFSNPGPRAGGADPRFF